MRFKEFLEESKRQKIDLTDQDFDKETLADEMGEDFQNIDWDGDIANVPAAHMRKFSDACKKLNIKI